MHTKFSPVINKDVVVPNLGDPFPYPADRLGKLVKYVPVKDEDKMTITWVLDYMQKDIDSQPLGYFSFLFGHEGPNSLLSYLKSEGLVSEISAGGDHELWCYSTFYLDISLTKKGLAQYEKVIEAIFSYAQKVRDANP